MITIEECRQWLANPTVNPKTGKRMQINRGPFMEYVEACRAHGLDVPNVSCPKWISLTPDEAQDYGYYHTIKCRNCGQRKKRLMALHEYDGSGDYTCIRCDIAVNLFYVCGGCRHQTDPFEEEAH